MCAKKKKKLKKKKNKFVSVAKLVEIGLTDFWDNNSFTIINWKLCLAEREFAARSNHLSHLILVFYNLISSGRVR